MTGKESAKQIFEIAQPYLDLAKAGSIQGLNMHAVLKNTDWSNPEELLNVLRSEQLVGKIPNTDEILQEIYKSQVNNDIIPSGRLIGAFTDKNLLLKEHIPLWEDQRKQIAALGPNAKWVDVAAIRNADLTDVLDKPIPIARGTKITPGSLGSDKWKGQSIFHIDMGAFTPSGGGTAALVRNTAFDVDLWKEALKGADPSLHPIGAGIGFAVDYALDPEYQKRIHNIVTGQAEQGDVPYVATKTAVNTVTGAISEYAARKTGLSAFIGAKAGSIFSVGLPLALGGSEDEKIRWSRLGYESKEAYDAAMKKHEEKEGSYEKPKPFINSLFNRN